ncbi:hypothetical protein PITCH_A1640037 [uncultured Desulfobacterium sp.]|uniref:AMP-activated protein kinase glycogen-binding domain-containing protein n=1 Tax=uncultured Desulfobacterium sp. TaxID=201089 RepID=A0A445MU54_9BACT|nr:hypothetical protein PITCH_A1640037 [uncultured Desulfobacterium sp.]
MNSGRNRAHNKNKGHYHHNWERTDDSTMERMEDSTWTKTISLLPGAYQYKFVLDDVWIEDQNNTNKIDNPFGGRNSIIELQ